MIAFKNRSRNCKAEPREQRRPGVSIGFEILVFLFVIFVGSGWQHSVLLAQSEVPQRDPLLETLLQAERTTIGSEDLQAAWQAVSKWPASRLPEVLAAADEANPVALNWLRSAIDGMLEQPECELPIMELKMIVQDPQRKYASRRIAWELLDSADPNLMESIAETLIADPIAVFRRPAIGKRVAYAATLEKNSEERRRVLRDAFKVARDEDQVGDIARLLDVEYGEKPDLAKHFGFIVNWHVVGPFPNIDEAGFHESFPPEQIKLSDFNSDGKPSESLEYAGNSGKVQWKEQAAVNDTGELDLNQVLGKEKEVVGYGVSVFECSTERPAEVRLRMQNAFKLWLNGELIQSQAIGHTGNSFDQYVIPVTLKQGKNILLMKSSQNKPPQEIEWYDTWHFNVRICDSSGAAIQEIK